MKNDERPLTKDEGIDRLVDRILAAFLVGLVLALIWHGLS